MEPSKYMVKHPFPIPWLHKIGAGSGLRRGGGRWALGGIAASLGLLCWMNGGAPAVAAPLVETGEKVWHAMQMHGVVLDDDYQQVRIQQQFSIRISPGPPVPPPVFVMENDRDDRPVKLEERNMGKCLPASAIVSVQSAPKNRLLFFLRDSRVVTAGLDKSCHAHDFYSGFYVERNADGQICIERDKIHSRSGANCVIHDLHALVEVPARR